MKLWMVLIIVVDLIIGLAIIAFVLRRRREQMQMPGQPPALGLIAGMKEMANFVNERHARIGEYLRANWSGTPDQLPQVLGSLLAELERDALARGVTMNRELLKTLIATSLRYHKIGRGSEVEKALQRVA